VWSTTSSSSKRVFAFFSLAVSSLAIAASPEERGGVQPFEAVEPHMGTLFRIKLYAATEAQAQDSFRAAFNRIAQLDDTLSDYKAGSELSRLSETAVRHPVAVSADLFRVVSAAQDLAEQTGGAFDMTLGPVIRLWREARKRGSVPDPKALRNAGKVCGYKLLKLDLNRHTVEFERAGMALDVGGIAKGYAADEALAALSALGIRSALVAASGDLAFSDAPPGKSGWKIGIDSFDEAHAPFTRILTLANAAVSTSGDTEQHLDANGKRYSHIIDPKTKLGLTKPLTVTIVARRGITADSLATAVSVLGAGKGMVYVNRRPGIAALIVMRAGDGPQVLESRHFPQD
jgi:FAD:protein FMN transferase